LGLRQATALRVRFRLISAWIFYFCRLSPKPATAGVARHEGILKLSGRSNIDAIRRAPVAAAAVLLAVAGLAGCGSVSERSLAGAFTSPGKYDIYTCADIERQMGAVLKRQTELEQLMSRASQGAGGEFVNTIAYRGEYSQGRGDLAELTRAKADKQCAVDSKFSSGRAVF
jgi:hypothetical protein